MTATQNTDMQNTTANNTDLLPAIIKTPDLSPAQIAEFEAQLLADAGEQSDTGFHASSFTPSLVIVQSQSTMLRPKNEKYVPGAQPGSIVHLGTREVLPSPVWLVPCYYRRFFKAWPSSGAPFEAGIDWDEYKALPKIEGSSAREMQTPNGPVEVVDTGAFSFLLLAEDMEPEEVEINMTSTQLDVARDFNKTVSRQSLNLGGRRVKAMPYAFAYKCESVFFEGDKGAWYKWQFSSPVQVPPGVYEQAKVFSESCRMVAESVDVKLEPGVGAKAGQVVKADVKATAAKLADADSGDSDLPF